MVSYGINRIVGIDGIVKGKKNNSLFLKKK